MSFSLPIQKKIRLFGKILSVLFWIFTTNEKIEHEKDKSYGLSYIFVLFEKSANNGGCIFLAVGR